MICNVAHVMCLNWTAVAHATTCFYKTGYDVPYQMAFLSFSASSQCIWPNTNGIVQAFPHIKPPAENTHGPARTTAHTTRTPQQ